MENKRTSRKRLTASKKRNMICKSQGCKNHSMHGGYCSQHGGGGRKCKSQGCKNHSMHGGYCSQHGGRRRRRTMRQRAGMFKRMYRDTHHRTLGRKTKGEVAEENARDAEENARVAEENARVAAALQEIRNNKDYIELNDVSELEVGQTYFEFVGDKNLKDLGKFEKKNVDGYYRQGGYGNNFTLTFENGELKGFLEGSVVWPNNTSLKGRVFKTNVAGLMDNKVGKDMGDIIASYGGRKRKTKRRSIKKQRKTQRKRLMKRQGGNDEPEFKDAYCKAYEEYLSKKNSPIRIRMPEQFRSKHGYSPKLCKEGTGFNF